LTPGELLGSVLVKARFGFHSFFDPASNLLYCHWEAEKEEAVLECLSVDVTKMAPIQHVSEIVLFDASW
jgi:hypothetical protein